MSELGFVENMKETVFLVSILGSPDHRAAALMAEQIARNGRVGIDHTKIDPHEKGGNVIMRSVMAEPTLTEVTTEDLVPESAGVTVEASDRIALMPVAEMACAQSFEVLSNLLRSNPAEGEI